MLILCSGFYHSESTAQSSAKFQRSTDFAIELLKICGESHGRLAAENSYVCWLTFRETLRLCDVHNNLQYFHEVSVEP